MKWRHAANTRSDEYGISTATEETSNDFPMEERVMHLDNPAGGK